jgi:hypothetical protein
MVNTLDKEGERLLAVLFLFGQFGIGENSHQQHHQ